MAPQTDDEQLEQLQKWWQENGSTVIIGLVIGLGAFGGWRFWQNYQQTQAENASSQYERVLESTRQEEQTSLDLNVGDLRDAHPGSTYASLAALMLAKHKADTEQADASVDNLDWVAKNATIPEIKHLATWRQARLLLSQNKPEEALALANSIEPDSVFASAFEELKGDIFTVQGKIQEARLAYDKVLSDDELAQQHKVWVQLKRDDLGTPNLPVVGDIVEPTTVTPAAPVAVDTANDAAATPETPATLNDLMSSPTEPAISTEESSTAEQEPKE